MRIARFEHEGAVRWGFVQADHLSIVAPGGPTILDALPLSADQLKRLADDCTERASVDDVRLLAPFEAPPQFIGIGLNYRDHAEEANMVPPEKPMSFGFLNSSIIGPGDPIEVPLISEEIDWEAELGVIISKPGKNISAEHVLDHVAGYVIINDVSARDIQDADVQFTRSKSLDTFKPMGPWMTTVDEMGDASDLDISLWIDDVQKQAGNTSNLIFDVRHLVQFLSASITLQAGAVISTGTPAGVGFSRTPPEFLTQGHQVRIEVEGIGSLINPVTREDDATKGAHGTR